MTSHNASAEVNDKMLVEYAIQPDAGVLVKSANSILPDYPRYASVVIAWVGAVNVGLVHPKSSVKSKNDTLPSG